MFNIQVVFFTLLGYVYAASQIALFTDSNCHDSYKGLEGPNGYPNGSCTDIRRSGDYGSLQVVGLDPGCGVTIYVNDNDTTICGGYQEEIQIGECWNSTFVYYSIDMCDLSASSSPSSTSSSTKSSSGPTTGTLAGGIIGGLAGVALILGLALWLLARKKRARKQAVLQAGEQRGVCAEAAANACRGEMDGNYQRYEMEEGKVVYKHQAAEVAQPPVELAGHEVGEYDARRGAP